MRRFWNLPEDCTKHEPGGRLSVAKTGSLCIVAALAGGSAMKRRLMDLGVLPGQEIAVLQNDGWGPVLLSVEGSRIVLGRQMAEKIIIHRDCCEIPGVGTFGPGENQRRRQHGHNKRFTS